MLFTPYLFASLIVAKSQLGIVDSGTCFLLLTLEGLPPHSGEDLLTWR